MSGKTDSVRRRARHAATGREILDAAWELARRDGLLAISLRELGAVVGMRAQSLYSYFPSKQAIYDAMFRDANETLLAVLVSNASSTSAQAGVEPLERATTASMRFFDFCVADPTRYQLLFQRVIPGFTPSTDSYAVAVEVYDHVATDLRSVGLTTQEEFDLWTGVIAGLIAQQIANDPTGDRWRRLIPQAVAMLLGELTPGTTQ